MSVKLNEHLHNEHTSTVMTQTKKFSIVTNKKAFLGSHLASVPTLISKI